MSNNNETSGSSRCGSYIVGTLGIASLAMGIIDLLAPRQIFLSDYIRGEAKVYGAIQVVFGAVLLASAIFIACQTSSSNKDDEEDMTRLQEAVQI